MDGMDETPLIKEETQPDKAVLPATLTVRSSVNWVGIYAFGDLKVFYDTYMTVLNSDFSLTLPKIPKARKPFAKKPV
jgi:hypothetical protein